MLTFAFRTVSRSVRATHIIFSKSPYAETGIWFRKENVTNHARWETGI